MTDRLAVLIEEMRLRHGQPWSERDTRLVDFPLWLQGLRDGMSVEKTPKQAPLL